MNQKILLSLIIVATISLLVFSCSSSSTVPMNKTENIETPTPQPTQTRSPSPTPDNRKMATVIDGMAQLCRSKGSTANSACFGLMTVGTSVEVVKQEGPWFYVKNSDKTGWVHGNYIRLVPPSPARTPGTTVSSDSDDIMRRIKDECARQAAAGDQSPLCGDVERNGIH